MSWNLMNTESLVLTQAKIDTMLSSIPLLSYIQQIEAPSSEPGYITEGRRDFRYDTTGIGGFGANPTDLVSRNIVYGRALRAYGKSVKASEQVGYFVDVKSIQRAADELDMRLDKFLQDIPLISSISATSKIKFFKLAVIIMVMMDDIYDDNMVVGHEGIDFLKACALLRRCLNRHPNHSALIDYSDIRESYQSRSLSVIPGFNSSTLEHPYFHAVSRLISGNPIYQSTWIKYSDRLEYDNMGPHVYFEDRPMSRVYHAYPNGIGSKSYDIRYMCSRGVERYAENVVNHHLDVDRFDLTTLADGFCTDSELMAFILPFDCMLTDGLTTDQDLGYEIYDMRYITDDEYKSSLKYLLFNFISAIHIRNENSFGCVAVRYVIDIPTSGEVPQVANAYQARAVDNWTARSMSAEMVVDEPERKSFVVSQSRSKWGQNLYQLLLTGLHAQESAIRVLCNQLISMMIASIGKFEGRRPPYNNDTYISAAMSQTEAVRTSRGNQPGVSAKCRVIYNHLVSVRESGIFDSIETEYTIPAKTHIQYTPQVRPSTLNYRPNLVRGHECMYGGRYGRVGLFVPAFIRGDFSGISSTANSLRSFYREWLDTYAGGSRLTLERWARIRLDAPRYHVSTVDIVSTW